MLVLGPYVGAETPHKRIPLNQGICGAAVTHGETVVVDDVNSDPRYLACSIETKSEIVAPIFVNGAVVGEFDIDSHLPAAFGPDDRRLVEHCAALVGRFLEKTRLSERSRLCRMLEQPPIADQPHPQAGGGRNYWCAVTRFCAASARSTRHCPSNGSSPAARWSPAKRRNRLFTGS